MVQKYDVNQTRKIKVSIDIIHTFGPVSFQCEQFVALSLPWAY